MREEITKSFLVGGLARFPLLVTLPFFFFFLRFFGRLHRFQIPRVSKKINNSRISDLSLSFPHVNTATFCIFQPVLFTLLTPSFLMTVTPKLKTILLPKKAASSSYEIVTLAHPRTRIPTRYLEIVPQPGSAEPTKLFELTEVSGDWQEANGGKPRPSPDDSARAKAHSFLFTSASEDKTDGFVVEEAKFTISTPISLIYFALDVLFDLKDKVLPLDSIHDLLESTKYTPAGCSVSIPYKEFEAVIQPFCDCSNGQFYKLSLEKLFAHLNRIVTRIIDNNGLPADIYKRLVVDQLTPPSSESLTAEIPQDIIALAVKQAAISLVCSNVPVDLSILFFETHDFSKLTEYINTIKKQKEAAIVQQQALQQQISSRKRGGAGVDDILNDAKKAKPIKTRSQKMLEKVDKSSMKSISSFFKPAPKK